MKLAHLVGLACVSLALITVSCNAPNNNKETLVVEGDTLPPIDSTQTVNGDGSSPDSVMYDADTLAMTIMRARNRYEIPVKEGVATSFCGQVNDPADTKVYKITFYFNKKGLSGAKKIAYLRLSGANTFNFTYFAPANGTLQMLVEEQRGVVWKNLHLKEVPSTPVECCDSSKKRMLKVRSTVATSDSSSSGTTVKVEQ